MKTKAFVNGLFALALLTPLGVQANGGNDTGGVLASVGTEESCLATFSVSDQTLTLPCVEVVMGTETVLYSAQLQQVAEGNFALTQVAELSAAVESECVANYSPETGELEVPCVGSSDFPNDTTTVFLHTDAMGTFHITTQENSSRTPRSALRPNWWQNSRCNASTDQGKKDYCSTTNPFYLSNICGTKGCGGQCTAHAWGRAYAEFGIKLSPTGNAGTWVDSSVTDKATGKTLKVGKEVRANSIVVWKYGTYGHVAYVEDVRNGYVYFTENNWSPSNLSYGAGYQENYSPLSISNFENRRGYKIAGYIYLQGPSLSVVDLWVKSGTPIYAGAKGGFDAQFKLKNLASQTVVVSKVAMAIHDANGKFVKDMRIDSNVSIASGSFYQMPKTVVDSPSLPGTYQVIAKVSMAKDSLNNDIWEELAKAWFTVK